MPESVVICMDVSDFMRNGDYGPTRLDAQQDATGLLISGKLGSNPENTVGLITYGCKGIRLLSSPTEDEAKLLSCLHGITPEGGNASGFLSGIKTAVLALKHRKNRAGGQRIIIFVGSPVEIEAPVLKKLADTLRKSNISVDIVLMGENEYNNGKLNEFINQVNRTTDNGRNDCHLVVIPPGIMPSEMIMTSPLYSDFGGSNAGGGNGLGSSGTGGGGSGTTNPFAEYGGFDPSIDPEMAMAMRISLEEARNAAAAVTNMATDNTATSSSSSSTTTATTSTNPPPLSALGEGLMDLDADAALQAALALSMADGSPVQPSTTSSSSSSTTVPSSSVIPPTPLTNSLPSSSFVTPAPPSSSTSSSSSSTTNPSSTPAIPPPAPQAPSTPAREPNPTPSPVAVDAEFARSLLADLPGVDINDPTIMAMLESLSSTNNTTKPGGNEDKDKKPEGQ